jgi:putative radical SAM enzyme (TIGR03279 family)
MNIIAVDKNSPLFGRISPGADLLKVNGHPVADEIDLQFYNTENTLELKISDNGRLKSFRLRESFFESLGLTFEQTPIKVCNNNCVFCFVHQQPKGMRRSLYIKDDDYRYSFTHGNYISLSNMKEADYERIINQRLSPLYISVHTTDDTLRRYIFQNEKLESVLPGMRKLIENGIILHTQIVVCPGINDGEHLVKTIADLAALSPGVASLAVVPVGLTRYRKRLPRLRLSTGKEAGRIIDMVEKYQRRFLPELGTRFVWPADEFYLMAGRKPPNLGSYEEMPQFENGVGMSRRFIVDLNRRKRFLPKKVSRPLRLELITSRLAEPFIREVVIPFLKRIKNLHLKITVVDNRFWGKTVTVTGLLTGKDILDAVKGSESDMVILPPNCLNMDNLFLDDISLDRFTTRTGRPVLTGTYDITALIRQAIRLWEN